MYDIPGMLSFFIPLIINIVNGLLVFVVRGFSLFERHHTISEMQVSVAFKLTLFRFLNSTAVLLGAKMYLGGLNSKKWFDSGNLA